MAQALGMWKNNFRIAWRFGFFSLSLHRRHKALRGVAGGLIYEKDVFGRLSLCITNLANPFNSQQADDNETSTW